MNKKIYIFAPARLASGGPEALHQLRYYMEKEGIDAWIVYIGNHKQKAEDAIPERYLHFFPMGKKCIWEDEYKDTSDNLIIMPEFYSFKLLAYPRSRRAIWWLGVFAYDGKRIDLDKKWLSQFNIFVRVLKRFKYTLKYFVDSAKAYYLYHFGRVVNYCASQFAYEFVNGKKHQKAVMLVEPISTEFLEAGYVSVSDLNARLDGILYNPSKPSEIMSILLERGRFNYIPIKGYTPEKMINLYRKNKLYVDFGKFPGPERMPKEAVYNGCNILVRKNNASVNEFDVAIPDKYKLENVSDPEMVEGIIQEMLQHYEEQFSDFDYFRKKIDNLEKNFENAIREQFADYIV